MYEKLKQRIVTGRFQDAEELAADLGREALEQALKEVGLEEQNLAAYAFLCHLIQRRETPENHFLASMLLSAAFSQLPGAAASALHHARRASELAPGEVKFKEYLLMFRDTPEELVSREEAEALAKEVLERFPDSMVARSVLGWF
jgi:hypothetical protein